MSDEAKTLRLQDWIDEFHGDPHYEFEGVAIKVGEQIVARMADLGMTHDDVAREMGVSPARVKQILRGNDNLTLMSIVRVAIALDARVEVRLVEPAGRQQKTATTTPATAPRK